MTASARHVPVLDGVDRQRFQKEIVPANRPVVLKGVAASWPAVTLARHSDAALIQYLKSCDTGVPANTLLGEPDIGGAFFYGKRPDTFNFKQGRIAISTALDRLTEQAKLARPHAVYIQSSLIKNHLPQFLADNVIDLVDESVEPRIWIGNEIKVQTHYDLYYNVACCVAGRRRFTLFPPDQLTNLYAGPLHKTLAGTPVSMASLEAPDFETYPRLRAALDVAQYAELEPGDALYIPYFWWHHVQSLTPFNVLVNFWWNPVPETSGSPYDVLLHASLVMKDMPADQLAAWKCMFDHFVFQTRGDPVAHLADQDKSAMGAMSPALRDQLMRQLIANLQTNVSGAV